MSTKILGVQLVNSTVDNTPVGGSTPSSGAFTQVAFPPQGNPGATKFWIDNPGSNQLRLSNGSSPGAGAVLIDFAGNIATPGAVTGAVVTSRSTMTASGAVTAPSFNGPPNGKTSNGYCTLLNGFILQWGLTSQFDTGPVSISFPTPFSNVCLNVQATDYFGLGNNASRIWSVESFTRTGFSIHNNGLGAALWMAVGY